MYLSGSIAQSHRVGTSYNDSTLGGGDRLRWGMGAGSTQNDFHTVNESIDGTFGLLNVALPNMGWRAKILIDGWSRSPWLSRATMDPHGWVASAHYTNLRL